MDENSMIFNNSNNLQSVPVGLVGLGKDLEFSKNSISTNVNKNCNKFYNFILKQQLQKLKKNLKIIRLMVIVPRIFPVFMIIIFYLLLIIKFQQ